MIVNICAYHGHKNEKKKQHVFIDIYPRIKFCPIRFVQFAPNWIGSICPAIRSQVPRLIFIHNLYDQPWGTLGQIECKTNLIRRSNPMKCNLVPRAFWRLRGHKRWKKTKPELQRSCSFFSQSAFTSKT